MLFAPSFVTFAVTVFVKSSNSQAPFCTVQYGKSLPFQLPGVISDQFSVDAQSLSWPGPQTASPHQVGRGIWVPNSPVHS